MGLKKIKPADLLLVEIRRMYRELGVAIAEYESQTTKVDQGRENKGVFLRDPTTGEKIIVKTNGRGSA